MFKNHERSRHGFFVVCLSILLLFGLTAKINANQAGQGRILKSVTYPFAPVEIIEIKVNDTPISFNQILGNDIDWINGLTVRVKNTSEKPISYISIDLRSEPPESGDKPRITSFSKGVLPVSRDIPVAPGNTLVAPDTFIEIPFTNEQFQIYKDYLQVSSLQVSVGSVFFTDDTLWMQGVLYTRDTKNPNKWNPVKSSVERLEKYYLQKRTQSLMQPLGMSPRTSFPALKPAAYKSENKGVLEENCRILSDAEWFMCDYLCNYWYANYSLPLEWGHWNYYEVFVNCSGPTYCYPYQTKMEPRLDCW